jgi:hypothetical protein
VRFEIDLCEKHSLELFGALMLWLDCGSKVGEAGIFDRQVKVRPVTVDLTAPRTDVAAAKAAPPAPVEDVEVPTNVHPIFTPLADDPDLPRPLGAWYASTGRGSARAHVARGSHARSCALNARCSSTGSSDVESDTSVADIKYMSLLNVSVLKPLRFTGVAATNRSEAPAGDGTRRLSPFSREL